MILCSLSALMTRKENCQVRRVALCKAAQDRHLDFIPFQCLDCKTNFYIKLDGPGPGVRLYCIMCEVEIRIEIQ